MSKVEFDNEYIQKHQVEFFKTRDGEYYPYRKDDIALRVSIHGEKAFYRVLKALDKPFFEREWKTRIQKGYTMRKVIGGYLSLMDLAGYKNFRWKDSPNVEKLEQLLQEKVDDAQ